MAVGEGCDDTHEDDTGFSATEGWRLAVLFLGLVALTALYQWANEAAERALKARRLRALRHVYRKLQEELLTLGFISLVLIAAQDAVEGICVKKPGAKGGYCGDDRERFLAPHTVHQAHIFLFVLAVTQVIYSCICLGLCLWKVGRWRKWEEGASLVVLPPNKPLEGRHFQGPGALLLRGLVSQFMESIDKPIYLGLRRLFVARMEVPDAFDFVSFVVVVLEEDYSRVISLEWPMLALTSLWLAMPREIILPMSIACLVALLVTGAKLEAVCLQLAQASYEHFSSAGTGGQSGIGRSRSDSFCLRNMPCGTVDPVVPADNSTGTPGKTVVDTAKLFWFGQPKMLLRIFQFSLFENALSITFMVFSLWQDPEYLSENVSYSRWVISMLVLVDLAIALHGAVFVLPVYALTAAAGSHCPTSVESYAKKLGIDAEAAAAAYEGNEVFEGDDEDAQRSVTALLGAMYSRKVQEERRRSMVDLRTHKEEAHAGGDGLPAEKVRRRKTEGSKPLTSWGEEQAGDGLERVASGVSDTFSITLETPPEHTPREDGQGGRAPPADGVEKLPPAFAVAATRERHKSVSEIFPKIGSSRDSQASTVSNGSAGAATEPALGTSASAVSLAVEDLERQSFERARDVSPSGEGPGVATTRPP
eukprot:CAMPEP_0183799224 /NCGR_PEP_ID=MMETSP0803_2-20130417/21018_1 /TAXON_ID=195967 /ORGANISM="Crustomastix stigmata, Strain CCMP3273" /LENGTH=647 /DNA_ID=CAMNT_0026043921 /DNA_START=24 /DNA_END=1963 /DNA_ORIENTATION=-